MNNPYYRCNWKS